MATTLRTEMLNVLPDILAN